MEPSNGLLLHAADINPQKATFHAVQRLTHMPLDEIVRRLGRHGPQRERWTPQNTNGDEAGPAWLPPAAVPITRTLVVSDRQAFGSSRLPASKACASLKHLSEWCTYVDVREVGRFQWKVGLLQGASDRGHERRKT